MIVLTKTNNQKLIYVNPDQIVYVEGGTRKGAIVHFQHGQWEEVDETAEKINRMAFTDYKVKTEHLIPYHPI